LLRQPIKVNSHFRGTLNKKYSGGIMMSRKGNRGTKAPGVNPQGYGQDAEFAEEPKSKLENAAKKKNTK
jgi:small acid-soluble spore protein L (minor)